MTIKFIRLKEHVDGNLNATYNHISTMTAIPSTKLPDSPPIYPYPPNL
jgi:hypothetical protein